MKKMVFLGVALLLATFLFVGCPNPSGPGGTNEPNKPQDFVIPQEGLVCSLGNGYAGYHFYDDGTWFSTYISVTSILCKSSTGTYTGNINKDGDTIVMTDDKEKWYGYEGECQRIIKYKVIKDGPAIFLIEIEETEIYQDGSKLQVIWEENSAEKIETFTDGTPEKRQSFSTSKHIDEDFGIEWQCFDDENDEFFSTDILGKVISNNIQIKPLPEKYQGSNIPTDGLVAKLPGNDKYKYNFYNDGFWISVFEGYRDGVEGIYKQDVGTYSGNLKKLGETITLSDEYYFAVDNAYHPMTFSSISIKKLKVKGNEWHQYLEEFEQVELHQSNWQEKITWGESTAEKVTTYLDGRSEKRETLEFETRKAYDISLDYKVIFEPNYTEQLVLGNDLLNNNTYTPVLPAKYNGSTIPEAGLVSSWSYSDNEYRFYDDGVVLLIKNSDNENYGGTYSGDLSKEGSAITASFTCCFFDGKSLSLEDAFPLLLDNKMPYYLSIGMSEEEAIEQERQFFPKSATIILKVVKDGENYKLVEVSSYYEWMDSSSTEYIWEETQYKRILTDKNGNITTQTFTIQNDAEGVFVKIPNKTDPSVIYTSRPIIAQKN